MTLAWNDMCQFPFSYLGKTYLSCSFENNSLLNNNGLPWCATEVKTLFYWRVVRGHVWLEIVYYYSQFVKIRQFWERLVRFGKNQFCCPCVFYLFCFIFIVLHLFLLRVKSSTLPRLSILKIIVYKVNTKEDSINMY